MLAAFRRVLVPRGIRMTRFAAAEALLAIVPARTRKSSAPARPHREAQSITLDPESGEWTDGSARVHLRNQALAFLMLLAPAESGLPRQEVTPRPRRFRSPHRLPSWPRAFDREGHHRQERHVPRSWSERRRVSDEYAATTRRLTHSQSAPGRACCVNRLRDGRFPGQVLVPVRGE
jgi:hypothetical protein